MFFFFTDGVQTLATGHSEQHLNTILVYCFSLNFKKKKTFFFFKSLLYGYKKAT